MTRTFDVLSSHRAIAEFTGIIHRQCPFLTSLCPDKCDHPKDFGTFKILEYEHHEKPGEYGDEKQTQFACNMNPNAHSDKQDPAILDQINHLQVGQKVRLTWDHIYVNLNGSRFPERPIKSIELL